MSELFLEEWEGDGQRYTRFNAAAVPGWREDTNAKFAAWQQRQHERLADASLEGVDVPRSVVEQDPAMVESKTPAEQYIEDYRRLGDDVTEG